MKTCKVQIPKNELWLNAITALYNKNNITTEQYIKVMRRNYENKNITLEQYATILRKTHKSGDLG